MEVEIKHDKVLRAYVEDSLKDRVAASAKAKGMTESKYVRELIIIGEELVGIKAYEAESEEAETKLQLVR